MNKPQKVAVLIVVAFPLVCCLGGAIVLFGASGRAKSSVESERASARRLGIPLEPSDIQGPPMREASNGASMYRKATQLLLGPLAKAQSKVNSAQGKNASEKVVQEGKQALAELKPVLDLIPELDVRPSCDFRRDYSKGPQLLFPELPVMKSLVKDLCFKAQIEDTAGDRAGSFKLMDYAHRVALDGGTDPVIIGMLVYIACRAISNREYELLIGSHAYDLNYLNSVEKLISSQNSLPDLRKYFGGEVVMERMALRSLGSPNALDLPGPTQGQGHQPDSPLAGFFRTPLIQDTFEAKVLSNWRVGWSQFPNDPNDWQGFYRAVKLMDDKVEKERGITSIVNQILFPVFSQAVDAIGNLQAHDRLLITSIELLKVRAQTGTLPVGLPAALGKTGIDPFDGNPLRYRRKGSGFILYSIGRDRRDDGGHVRNPKDPEGTGSDEVLEFK